MAKKTETKTIETYVCDVCGVKIKKEDHCVVMIQFGSSSTGVWDLCNICHARNYSILFEQLGYYRRMDRLYYETS